MHRLNEKDSVLAKKIDKDAGVRNSWNFSWLQGTVELKWREKEKEKLVEVKLGDTISKINEAGKAVCSLCEDVIRYGSNGKKALTLHVTTAKHVTKVKDQLTNQSVGSFGSTNQIQREIMCTVKSIPLMSLPTCVCFYMEVRGYSKLYDNVQDSMLGWPGLALSTFTFIAFTDACIYWIHRGLHHRAVYRHLHKIHHTWKVPTPFASHAFHPLDGFLQSLPYHLYVFLFPMHKVTYLALFVFVNIWTVSIHDGDYRVPQFLQSIVNGCAHHTDHHLFYSYNYGQFFTLWDHVGGSFRNPSAFEGKGPLKEVMGLIKKEGKCGMVNGSGKKAD